MTQPATDRAFGCVDPLLHRPWTRVPLLGLPAEQDADQHEAEPVNGDPHAVRLLRRLVAAYTRRGHAATGRFT